MSPLHAFTKLFRSLFHLRLIRAEKRERLPWELRLKSRQEKLTQRARRDWRGGYILQDDGDYAYVPAQLDVTVLERLTYKPAPEPIIAKLCPVGGTVMDIGANLGDWTLAMANAVGREGRVYAFEPIPYLAEAISKTLRINGFTNSQAREIALSDQEGEASFTLVLADNELVNVRCSGLNGGTSDLDVGGATAQTITVTTTTLDSFVAAEGLERLDFIKIDVERHEAQVLGGAKETLARFRPAVIFEAGNEEEADRRAIHQALSSLGYEITGIPIEHGIVETDWQAYLAQEAPFAPNRHCNVLCLPSS